MYKITASPVLNVACKDMPIITPFFVVEVYQDGQTKKVICNWTKAIKFVNEVRFSDLGVLKERQLWSVSGCNDLLHHRFIEPKNGRDLMEKIIVTLLTATDGDRILFCWDDKEITENGFYQALNLIDENGNNITPDKESLSLENHGFSLKDNSPFMLIDVDQAMTGNVFQA